ncbi:MAG: Chromosome-partitioning ATPase Soj [Syntrophus sp. SKADARSKE-3]|nr:Chromosome-partitioning ATPase Soj [Syntrophus sp. SKADARSKE-3]
MSKPIIIVCTNHKGGSGKSITSIMLSSYLLNYFPKVAIIDTDSQAHTSYWLSNDNEITGTIGDLLKYSMEHNIRTDPPPEELLERCRFVSDQNGKALTVIPASLELGKTKNEINAMSSMAIFKARDAIQSVAKDYDVVMIDTGPTLDFMTSAAVAASDYVILPIMPDALSINGALQIIDYIMPNVLQYLNPKVEILGVVIGCFARSRNADAVLSKAKEIFGDKLFNTIISRSVRVQELSSFRDTFANISQNTKSAEEFASLAEEVYKRLKEETS